MQRRAIDTGAGEGVLVSGVVARWRKVRHDVGRVGSHRDRRAEVDLLPTASRLASKCGPGHERASTAPQCAAMRTGITDQLVEADAINEPVGVGAELEADLDGAGVAAV